MKKIIVTIAIIINAIASFAQDEGKLAYRRVTQSYKGDTVYVKLNTDTTNYWTDKKAFDFNKDIFVKGIKLGSGGGSDIAKYLKNFSPNDTVISFVAKSGTTGMQIQSTQANQCLKLINSYMYGKGILSQVSGAGSIAGYFDASGSTANTAFGVRINSKIATSFRVDSLNNEKFSISAGGIPKITRYSGSGIRSLSVNNNGEIIPGSSGSTIATQLKNYDNAQDTVIRFPNLQSGKYGVYCNTNSGMIGYFKTNNGFINFTETNNSNAYYILTNSSPYTGFWVNNNYGYSFRVSANGVTGVGFECGGNKGIAFTVPSNYSGGKGFFVDRNYSGSSGFMIRDNAGIGWSSISNSNTAIGIKSFAADTVSLTSGARTGIFGKSGYYTDIDGFGQLRLFRNNVLKLKIDTAGHILNDPPHAYSIDTTSNFNITLTQNVWKQVTNATKNFWSNNAELDYFSFTGDTVVLAKQGHYAGDFNINIAGASGATYEYRIIQKNGTAKIVNKFTVKGTGEIVYRNVPFYVQGVKGTKIWVEIRFTGAPTGSPITVTGGLFRIFPIHLQ